MKDVFRSKSVPIKLKIQIFEAACVSILLYGCESWIINQKLNNALNSFKTNCYRIMLCIKRIDEVSNVYKIVCRNHLTLQDQDRHLRYLGHSLRRNENDFINKYVFREQDQRNGPRGADKPRMIYHKYIGELINKRTPPTINEMRKVASKGTPGQARKEWKKFLVGFKSTLFEVD
jgi:hypothetical protein